MSYRISAEVLSVALMDAIDNVPTDHECIDVEEWLFNARLDVLGTMARMDGLLYLMECSVQDNGLSSCNRALYAWLSDVLAELGDVVEGYSID